MESPRFKWKFIAAKFIYKWEIVQLAMFDPMVWCQRCNLLFLFRIHENTESVRLYHSRVTERCILDWAEWSNQLGRKQNVLECCKPNHMVNPMPWTIPDWAFAFLGVPVCTRKYLESIIYDSLRMSNHSQSWLVTGMVYCWVDHITRVSFCVIIPVCTVVADYYPQ